MSNNEGMGISLENIASRFSESFMKQDVVVFEGCYHSTDKEFFPLRMEPLLIEMCTQGSGAITIDLCEYEIRPGTVIILQPRNYIGAHRLSEDYRSHGIACTPSLMEELFPKLTDILPHLINHRFVPVVDLTESKRDEFDRYYSLLSHLVSAPPTRLQKSKVKCVFEAAMLELIDFQSDDEMVSTFGKSRKEQLMAEFIIAVGENFKQQRQVTFYADKLRITPKHLSSVVKSISGKTAGEWIENFVVMEAKVLLKKTDLPVQEIATVLSFPNQSFFGKYFKKITGVSPTQFRKNLKSGV